MTMAVLIQTGFKWGSELRKFCEEGLVAAGVPGRFTALELGLPLGVSEPPASGALRL